MMQMGGEDTLESDIQSRYANVHEEISYQPAKFQAASGMIRDGYSFDGWNTESDGTGDSYYSGDSILLTEDLILYAQWTPLNADYKIEHYKQDINDPEKYILTDTQDMKGIIGDDVSAEAMDYTGFTEDKTLSEPTSSGKIVADGSLVLKLYYDRNIYPVSFDLNGAKGDAPEMQEVPYEDFLKSVDEPSRTGYTFKGWYLDEEGTEGKKWDFEKPVEENTQLLSVTLYAKWVDDIAPVLGESSFNDGYKNRWNWIIRQKDLIITIPITEEGSGVTQAELKVMEAISFRRWSDDLLTAETGDDANEMLQILEEDGLVTAKITISEDFKGTLWLTCTDKAGNQSLEKSLTASGNGLIVENNAPEVSFSSPDGDLSEDFTQTVTVNVTVKDDLDDSGNEEITGGIATVTYTLDGGEEISVPDQDFDDDMVESCDFSVELSGASVHTLTVTAIDNADNETTKQVDINIKKLPGDRTPIDSKPTADAPIDNAQIDQSPKMGDFMRAHIYMISAIIAMFLFLFLYLAYESRGMTESEKGELVSQLIRWGQEGNNFKKMLGLTAVFFLLLYYHSIGKHSLNVVSRV